VELWIGAINLGFVYAFMTLGVFITFRIHNFPDITVDGSFVTGAAVTAVLVVGGVDPVAAMALSFLAGACAGAVTAFIHTRFDVNGLLAGILVMTGLYSVNLHIMGKSNIPLLNEPGITAFLRATNPGIPYELWFCLVFAFVILALWAAVSLFFRTDFGIAMRATGNNAAMAGASGVNVNRVKTAGIALANGFVGLSGSLVAQYQGFADIGMGTGTIVFGLAAVIIGESVIRTASFYGRVFGVILGSIVFRLMVALALDVGLNPIDLKLITAVFVLAILIAPKLFPGGKAGAASGGRRKVPARKKAAVFAALAAVVVLLAAGYRYFQAGGPSPGGEPRIGVVQLSDHGLLNITRDSFVEEMRALGYENGRNAVIELGNANGDMVTVNSILDRYLRDDADVILTLSTGCTQAAVGRIKDRPVVFATVANPFIIGAGRTDADHLPNVTGVYGPAPTEQLVELVTSILPGRIRVGCIWDPSQQNAVFNVERLKEVLRQNGNVAFAGTTVSGSSEVYQAAVSLAAKGIDAFVLTTDNIVFSAFESVVKAASAKKIPIFISDVERLGDGALAACGFDYRQSGIQAARLVDRVLKGESPAAIPFERYRKVTVGVNPGVAAKLGIAIPPAILARANAVAGDGGENGRPKRLALFLFSDNHLLKVVADGVTDELKKSGTLRKYNVSVDLKNAQNDYGTARAIVQDMVRKRYDFIVTASSLALQATAGGNSAIPHVFGAVTDPYRMGVAKAPGDHLPNITGVATVQPVAPAVEAMRTLFPRAKRIGIVWNPAEVNSEVCTGKAREAARRYGFTLLEKTVGSTSEVKDAVSALLNEDIDLFFTSGDSTVILALPYIAEVLKEHRIPYFTNDPTDVDRGAFFSIGADYYEVGVETARMAERVIAGEKPAGIPIRDYVPEKIGINEELAKRYGVTFPGELVKRAGIVRR